MGMIGAGVKRPNVWIDKNIIYQTENKSVATAKLSGKQQNFIDDVIHENSRNFNKEA